MMFLVLYDMFLNSGITFPGLMSYVPECWYNMFMAWYYMFLTWMFLICYYLFPSIISLPAAIPLCIPELVYDVVPLVKFVPDLILLVLTCYHMMFITC